MNMKDKEHKKAGKSKTRKHKLIDAFLSPKNPKIATKAQSNHNRPQTSNHNQKETIIDHSK